MLESRSGRPRRNHLRTLLAGILMAVIVVSAMYAIGSGIANRKRTDVIAAWSESFVSEDGLYERYPRAEANEAALEVERLSAALGIDIAPKPFDGRARPAVERAREHDAIKAEIGRFLETSFSRTDSALAAPPDELASYFAAQENELAELRSALREGEIPRWEMHVQDLWEASIPNLLGHMKLQRLLLADAVSGAARGETEKALADLDASWRLNASLRESPFVISQLISVAVARMQAGTLRRLGDVPASWRDRLKEHDHRASLMESLRYEGWMWTKLDDPKLLGAEGTAQRVALRLARPYVRYCLFDSSDRWRQAIDRLDENRPPCGVPTVQAALHRPAPGWNVFEKIVVPNLLDAVDRVARLEIDIELTDRWLALQNARAKNRGAWPASLADREPSRACAGEHWIYALDDGGEASVSLSRELSWPGHRGLVLPTRHSSARGRSDT